LLAWWWLKSGPSSHRTATTSAQTPDTNPPGWATLTKPEFQKLAGTWVRPDGGYVLEIRSIDNLGAMDAAYFNPAPIRVSKAVAVRENALTRVYVELRDVNYPGCTYTLVYDPASDRLAGDYYQAAIGEHFDVEFSRKQ